jgi:hypothetical protein
MKMEQIPMKIVIDPSIINSLINIMKTLVKEGECSIPSPSSNTAFSLHRTKNASSHKLSVHEFGRSRFDHMKVLTLPKAFEIRSPT